MSRRIQRTIGMLVAVLSVATLVSPMPSASAAEAAPSESITLSPVSRDYKVDAGKEVSDELTIVNDGKVPYDFIVYSRPYSVQSELYEPDFTKIKSNTDVYQWIRFPKTKYRLEAGKTTKVPFTMAVPGSAVPGGHYGVIFAETQPADEGSNTSVIRKKRVGMIVYANVNGTYTNEGKFLDVSMPFWQLQPPMTADLRVENSGTSDFKNTVRHTVKDVFGNTKYDATKQYPVLPQTVRKIGLSWDQSPWFGLFKVEISQKFLDQEKTTSGYVLMMPRFIPVVLLVLAVAGGGYALYRRTRK